MLQFFYVKIHNIPINKTKEYKQNAPFFRKEKEAFLIENRNDFSIISFRNREVKKYKINQKKFYFYRQNASIYVFHQKYK